MLTNKWVKHLKKVKVKKNSFGLKLILQYIKIVNLKIFLKNPKSQKSQNNSIITLIR